MVNIPIELFIQIIREATRMPEIAIRAPDRDFLVPSEALLARSSLIIPQLLEISCTKLNLCLVSRLCNDICQNFMYEFLIIRRGETILLLLEKLLNHSIDPSLVLRIDVLSISINRGRDERLIPKPLLTKLVMLCQELRAFAVQTDKFYLDNAHFAHALAKLPHLEHLFVCILWDGVFYKQLLLQMSAYSSAMVFLGYKKGYCGLIDVAERLSGDFLNFPIEDIPEPPKFQDNNGMDSGGCFIHVFAAQWVAAHSILSSVHILPLQVLSLDKNVLNMVPWNVSSALPMTLRSIIFDVHDIFDCGWTNFTYIEYVGLRGNFLRDACDYCFKFLLEEYLDKGLLFPALKVIRFMEPKFSEGFKKQSLKLKKWQRRCDSKGIRLEDPGGREVDF